jgi:hypothetical protein
MDKGVDKGVGNIPQLSSLTYPCELFDAYEKYNTDKVSFDKWIKTVYKYTTYYYETNSYYTVYNYYTVKDNIVATVTGRKFRL